MPEKATLTVKEVKSITKDFCKFVDEHNSATWNVNTQGDVTEAMIAKIQPGVRFTAEYNVSTKGQYPSRWINKLTKATGEDTTVEKAKGSSSSAPKAASHGNAGGGEFMRSKEQCMAGEALQAAATFCAGKADTGECLEVAYVFYEWILKHNPLDAAVSAVKDAFPEAQLDSEEFPEDEFTF